MPSGSNSKWIILAASTKIIKTVLTCNFCNLSSARENSFNTIPCCVVSFHLRIELETPTFITSHNSLQKTRSWSTISMKLQQHSIWCSLCSVLKECGTNLKQIFLFSKSLSKIFLATSLPTPRCALSSLVVICLFSITRVWVFMIWMETGPPGQGSSSSNSLPSWKHTNHWKTCAQFSHHHTHFSGHGTFTWQFPPSLK